MIASHRRLRNLQFQKIARKLGIHYASNYLGHQRVAFAVHSEYINRPSVFIIDPEGVIRFAYRSTYWGDRPSMHEVLEMIKTGSFEFEHPKRLPAP